MSFPYYTLTFRAYTDSSGALRTRDRWRNVYPDADPAQVLWTAAGESCPREVLAWEAVSEILQLARGDLATSDIRLEVGA